MPAPLGPVGPSYPFQALSERRPYDRGPILGPILGLWTSGTAGTAGTKQVEQQVPSCDAGTYRRHCRRHLPRCQDPWQSTCRSSRRHADPTGQFTYQKKGTPDTHGTSSPGFGGGKGLISRIRMSSVSESVTSVKVVTAMSLMFCQDKTLENS